MNITASFATIVVGNEPGTIFLVNFYEGVLKFKSKFRFSRTVTVYSLRVRKLWVLIVWKDGMIAVWDTIAKKQLGNIENPEVTDTHIDEHHFFAYFDGVLRVHENKLGLKLKYTVKLSVQNR